MPSVQVYTSEWSGGDARHVVSPPEFASYVNAIGWAAASEVHDENGEYSEHLSGDIAPCRWLMLAILQLGYDTVWPMLHVVGSAMPWCIAPR